MTNAGKNDSANEVVDAKARRDLAECLRHLVCGRMTNDDFDIAYYERWYEHSDAAVAEIAQFGFGLYGSDLLGPINLKGAYKVTQEERSMAARAILFLQTNTKYEYPVGVQGWVPFWGLCAPGFYLLIGLVLLIAAFLWPEPAAVWCGVVGVLAVLPSLNWLATRQEREEEVRRFQESGDFDVWPFLRRSDLEAARRTPRFLTGGQRPIPTT